MCSYHKKKKKKHQIKKKKEYILSIQVFEPPEFHPQIPGKHLGIFQESKFLEKRLGCGLQRSKKQEIDLLVREAGGQSPRLRPLGTQARLEHVVMSPGRPRQVQEKINLLPHLRSPGTRGRRTQGSHLGMLGVCICLLRSCPQTPKATGLHVDHVQSHIWARSLGRQRPQMPCKGRTSNCGTQFCFHRNQFGGIFIFNYSTTSNFPFTPQPDRRREIACVNHPGRPQTSLQSPGVEDWRAWGCAPPVLRQMETPAGLWPQTPGHCLALVLSVKEGDRQSWSSCWWEWQPRGTKEGRSLWPPRPRPVSRPLFIQHQRRPSGVLGINRR